MSTAKPKTAPAHPPYVVMVKAAITSLKEKTGSSIPAIFKYLTNNYTGVDKKILSTQLKKLVASGKLVKVKASYKLGDALKQEPKKKKAPKKKAPKKKAPKKKVVKKKVAKKPAKKTAKKVAKKPAKKPAKKVAKKAK